MNASVVANAPWLGRRVNARAVLFIGGVMLLLGWPVYTFVSEWVTGGVHDRGSYFEADLKAMGFFQFSPERPTVKDVPKQFRELDGKRVLIEGIVQPTMQAGAEVTEFSLVYSEVSCCIGYGKPLVQEHVYVRSAGGKRLTVDRSKGKHRVMGTLHVGVKVDDVSGEVVEVYRMDADSVD